MAKNNNINNNVRVAIDESIPVVTGTVDMSDMKTARDNMELASKTQNELMVQDKIISATLRGKRLELQAANNAALKALDKARKDLDAKKEAYDGAVAKFRSTNEVSLTKVMETMAKQFQESAVKTVGELFPFTGDVFKPTPIVAFLPSVHVYEEKGKIMAAASFKSYVPGTVLRNVVLPISKDVQDAYDELKDAEQAVEQADKLIDEIQTQAAACSQLEEQLRHAADTKACELLDPTGERRQKAKAMADSLVKVPTVKQLAAPKSKK